MELDAVYGTQLGTVLQSYKYSLVNMNAGWRGGLERRLNPRITCLVKLPLINLKVVYLMFAGIAFPACK